MGEKEKELEDKEKIIANLERRHARERQRLRSEVRAVYNELDQNRAKHNLAMATMIRQHQEKMDEFQAISDFLA